MGNLKDLHPPVARGQAHTAKGARVALQNLWGAAGLPDEALDHVELHGAEPVLPSSFAVGTAAQASIA
ncbi:carnitine dehydratase, partial [Bordetella pertussis]